MFTIYFIIWQYYTRQKLLPNYMQKCDKCQYNFSCINSKKLWFVHKSMATQYRSWTDHLVTRPRAERSIPKSEVKQVWKERSELNVFNIEKNKYSQKWNSKRILLKSRIFLLWHQFSCKKKNTIHIFSSMFYFWKKTWSFNILAFWTFFFGQPLIFLFNIFETIIPRFSKCFCISYQWNVHFYIIQQCT